MADTRSCASGVFVSALIALILSPLLGAQARTPADHLKAGIAHIEAGDFLVGLMTLNEVVSPGSSAGVELVAAAHVYRAQANLSLNQPERARAAALLAMKMDSAIVVNAPLFPAGVVALFDDLRRASTVNPEEAGQAAEKAGRYEDAFLAYLRAFQSLSDPAPAADDRRLRERIIEVARVLKAEPVIPSEAQAHFAKAEELLAAEALLGGLGTASSDAAATELRRAIRIAPWWPEATFKLAGVLQKLQRVDEALTNLALYRLADPDGYAAAMSAKSGPPAERAPARIAPAPPRAPVAPARASIYIYWPRQVRGAVAPKVSCDGFHVADLRNRHFVLLQVTPGMHNIQIDTRTLAISFQAGQTYYVRVNVGGFGARREARQVMAEEATPELNDKDMSANEQQRTYSNECKR